MHNMIVCMGSMILYMYLVSYGEYVISVGNMGTEVGH